MSEPDAPVGYVPFAQSAVPGLAATTRLRTASVWLICASAAFAVASAVALRVRVGTLDEFLAGTGSIESVETMDAVVGILAVAELLTLLIAGIVVMVWTYRIVRNAQAVGRRSIGVKLAAFGWIIPIGNMWVPFARLRSVAEVGRCDSSLVTRWQVGWIALTLIGFSTTSTALPVTRDDFSNEATLAAFIAVVNIVVAFVAQRAIRKLDDGIAEFSAS